MYEICKWKKISVITYQDAMKEAILHGPSRFHKAAVPMGYVETRHCPDLKTVPPIVAKADWSEVQAT